VAVAETTAAATMAILLKYILIEDLKKKRKAFVLEKVLKE